MGICMGLTERIILGFSAYQFCVRDLLLSVAHRMKIRHAALLFYL